MQNVYEIHSYRSEIGPSSLRVQKNPPKQNNIWYTMLEIIKELREKNIKPHCIRPPNGHTVIHIKKYVYYKMSSYKWLLSQCIIHVYNREVGI